jgi:hypothetical protein
MRKFLITLVIVIALAAAISILWIVAGRYVSLFLDRFGTIATSATPIKSLVYEGSGTGGIIRVNGFGLSLDLANSHAQPPNIGTTKDGQIALSFGGKVFAFGPPQSGTESLATEPQPGDETSTSVRHSALSWPTFFDTNFMTGQSPSWKRHIYYRLVWKKQNGATLEMLWRFEQYYYASDAWTSGLMTREDSTGLIRVDISSPLPSPLSSP